MISATAIFFSAVISTSGAASATCAARHASLRILSSLPITRSTSAICANIAGSICAAHPVTTMRAEGRSRLKRRIDCRVCATASLVTAQLLMMTTSSRPASSALRRMTSDSKALSRQPKVMTSTDIRPPTRTAPDRRYLHIRIRPDRSSAHDRRARAIRRSGCRREARHGRCDWPA